MRLGDRRREIPIWVWALVVVAAFGVGLLIRSLLSGGSGGEEATATPAVRCPDPSGGELALSETVTPRVETAGVVYARAYQLERPGQPPLAFQGGGDARSGPLSCERVLFGPGPRVSFGRGPEAFVVELVGPAVRRFSAAGDRAVAALAVEPRWNLRLRLEDYEARPPRLDEAGRGELVLDRSAPGAGLPQRIVLTTQDGGSTFRLDRAATLGSVAGS